MIKLNTLHHCTNAGFCAKKSPKSAKRLPETLDNNTDMCYNKHVVRGRRKYDMRRGRIKNRVNFVPLNKNPPHNIKPQYHRATSVIIIII
nr:MAG TPA: hypothetical protein [Caudoviricetes sp.]